MLKLLLRLWWLQQRRNFQKKDVVVGCYMLFFYVVVGISIFQGFTESGETLEGDALPATLGAGIAIGMLIPDIIMKMVMKRDITAMDDYVKSRPVSEKVWNRFLLTTNLLSFWNYVQPVLMVPVLLWLLPLDQAVLSFLLFLSFSYINGIYITCYRKATAWIFKWPLVLGWICMFVVLIGYLLLAAFFPTWMGWLGLFVLAVAVLAGQVFYLYHLKIYNEQKHKSSRFRGFNHISLFSLQYIGTMRAKRIRNMVLLITAIFLYDVYFFALSDMETEQGTPTLVYVVGLILLPSVCLSQWTFGIEANFFQGLMTKPVRVEQMLRNCFYFNVMVSAVALLFVVPMLFLDTNVGAMALVSGFSLAVFVNLFNLPTCLFSSRLEIFNGSLFNMQGANMKINLFGIVFLIPLGGVTVVYWLFGETAWCLTCVALALLALALHRWFIGKIAALFYKRRYDRMEKFMN